MVPSTSTPRFSDAETINDYLCHNSGTWDGDSNLIRVVGAYLKGKARDWYNNRVRQLRAN